MYNFDSTPSADAILVQALLEANGSIIETPEEKARTLLFSWVLSLKPGIDLADAALDLKYQLLSASPETNPLLPHLCELLDEVYLHAGHERRRRRRARADA